MMVGRDMVRRIVVVTAAAACAIVALSGPDALAQGCAMCRTAVEGQNDPLTRGISLSVIFMVSMPFAIFTTIAGWLYISHRRGVDSPDGGATLDSDVMDVAAAGSGGAMGPGPHSAPGAGAERSGVESGGSQT